MSACCRSSEADRPPYSHRRAWPGTEPDKRRRPWTFSCTRLHAPYRYSSRWHDHGAALGMGPEATKRDAVDALSRSAALGMGPEATERNATPACPVTVG